MTICLAMIVRDEAKVIERCLESVYGLADSYVIVDTGSQDDTRERIQRGPLDGELHDRKWVNFGHNRTELMELAYGKADWLLLLDADMTIRFDNGDHDHFTGLLSGDSYMLRHAGEPQYWVKRLVRGDKRWRYIGVTHEYIEAVDGEQRPVKLDAVTVHHHYDGGHRPEKFERDLDLLSLEHKRNPDDTRTTFYLANTLRDLGRTEEAVAMYWQRTKQGGWEEEVFYSTLEAGKLSNDLTTLLRAWGLRPTRAEPLYELAWRLRQRKWWAPAHLLAKAGSELPVPSDTLFVHRWVYEWGCDFELSIAAVWAGDFEAAEQASDRLLDCPTLPAPYREQVIENRRFLP